MLELLTRFCATDDPRAHFLSPQRAVGCVLATDGLVMFRTPVTAELQALFPHATYHGETWSWLVDKARQSAGRGHGLPPLPQKPDCQACDERVTPEACRAFSCALPIGRVFFDRKRLSLIAELPGLRLYPRGQEAAYFNSPETGADGLILPIQPW